MKNVYELLRKQNPETVWQSTYPHSEQLKIKKEGLGRLQRETNLAHLKETFRVGIAPRFSPEEQTFLMNTYDLAMELHKGQPPRRTGASVGTHLARVAISNLRDDHVSLENTAVRLLHDSIEDGTITAQELTNRLTALTYSQAQASMIVDGVTAMSMRQNNIDLLPEAYEAGLIRMDQQHPELYLLEIKADDRADNVNDDSVSLLKQHILRRNRPDYRHIVAYLTGKAARAVALTESLGDNPSRTRLLAAIDTCHQFLREKQPSSVPTLQQAS